MEKRWNKSIILLVIVGVIAIAAVYFTFFYSVKCKDIACWETKMNKCSKANYINEKNDVIWSYSINGKKSGSCEINVELVEIKKGLVSTKVLEGKNMNCRLPLGAINSPESNINLCNGILKEEMQALIITKLHEYIVQNLGQINENILSPIGGSGVANSLNQTSSNSTNSSG